MTGWETRPTTARRAEVDQAVLANLLRLNLARAAADGAQSAVKFAEVDGIEQDAADADGQKNRKREKPKAQKARNS